MYKQLILAKEFDDEGSLLPCLKDLVSSEPQPDKDVILDYLNNLGVLKLICMSGKRDILNPEDMSSASEGLFDDGVWKWHSSDIYYITKYNIPLPDEMLEHIMRNYKDRKRLKLYNSLIDSVSISINAYLGYTFDVSVNKKGEVFYKNNSDCHDGAYFLISHNMAELLLRNYSECVFMNRMPYDGKGAVIDGYHWVINFYNRKGISYSAEGYQDESYSRYRSFSAFASNVENIIGKSLGVKLMGREYKDD